VSRIIALTRDDVILDILRSPELPVEEPVRVVESLGRALEALKEDPHQVFLLDSQVDVGSYLTLVRRVRKTAPECDVLIVGGPKSARVERDEGTRGVDHYYPRPIEAGDFLPFLAHVLELRRVKTLSGILGRSPGLRAVLETVIQLAPTDVPVLIQGESGTGKELVAQAIHRTSRRRNDPFEDLNVGSLADGVLESELFGHEKGSFTGAVQRRAGLFQRADGGTIFLDEVGEMSHHMQVRLLRAIETGEVLRVGGREREKVNIRIVSATNRDLEEEVRNGGFRSDLYYRLRVVLIEIPPLRERREDIPLLARHFVRGSNREHGTAISGISREAVEILQGHAWPGNVRELRNVISSAAVLAREGTIRPEHLPRNVIQTEGAHNLPVHLSKSREDLERELIYNSLTALHRDIQEILFLLRTGNAHGPMEARRYPLREVEPGEEGSDEVEESDESLRALEKSALLSTLEKVGGNRRKAAEKLGISERTLYRKIKEYGL
jgi:DNA-binding NtrC family response regulator